MRQWTIDELSDSPQHFNRASELLSEVSLRREVNATAFGNPAQAAFPCSPSTFSAKRLLSFSNEIDQADDDDEVIQCSQRLSRHIPQREGVDMSMSSFNLIVSPACISPSTIGSPHSGAGLARQISGSSGGGFGTSFSQTGVGSGAQGGTSGAVVVQHRHMATGTVARTPSSSTFTNLSDSIVSDDSSHMTSLYNDMLADSLIRPLEGGRSEIALSFSTASPLSGKRWSDTDHSGEVRHSLGGDVLSFADVTKMATRSFGGGRGGGRASDQATVATTGLSALQRSHQRKYYSASGNGSHSSTASRIFNVTPERVLDAPNFPADAKQLLDWGSNNSLVIGMGSSLYLWNGDKCQSTKAVTLMGGIQIRHVHWLHKSTCIAVSVPGGVTAIFDCRSKSLLRTVRMPAGLEISGISVNGPTMAVSSNGPQGTTCVFDLRSKDALIATFSGHESGVSSLSYSKAEPFYLATGGTDGCVRVWDARKASSPRYSFDSVHHGGVSVLHWNPQKRSQLFSGGEDGVLCLVDTHAPRRTIDMSTVDEEGVGWIDGSGGGSCSQDHLAQYVVRAVKTQHPITGIVCNGPCGEVATAHKGKGHLQLRKINNFHLLSTFNAPHCSAPLNCLVLAPDKERVCAAQGDETLKFWRIFDSSVACSKATSSAFHGEWGATRHEDPGSLLHETLR